MQAEGILFLFTDSQIVDERMLVFINDLLSSGEIPDLFATEDRDEIVNAMRGETKAQGLVDTSENCWSVFIQRVSLPVYLLICSCHIDRLRCIRHGSVTIFCNPVSLYAYLLLRLCFEY